MIDQVFSIAINLFIAVQIQVSVYFIKKWINNTDARISNLEDKVTDHGERISVLESRAPKRERKAS